VKVQVKHNIKSGDFMDEIAYDIGRDPDERNPQDPTEIGAREVAEKLRWLSEFKLRSEDRGSTDNIMRTNSGELDERMETPGYK
jgi:hypothetical protein